MITLYHAPQTRSSRMIWLLEELGVPYEIRPVSIFRPMTGEGSGDRADLFIARQQQEGWRAAIALDADGVEPGLRVRQLAVTMGRYRTAGVQVWIDQRTERLGAFG